MRSLLAVLASVVLAFFWWFFGVRATEHPSTKVKGIPVAVVKPDASLAPLVKPDELGKAMVSVAELGSKSLRHSATLPTLPAMLDVNQASSRWESTGPVQLEKTDYYGWVMKGVVTDHDQYRQVMLSLSLQEDTLFVPEQPIRWFSCTSTSAEACSFTCDKAGAVTGCACEDSTGQPAVFQERLLPRVAQR